MISGERQQALPLHGPTCQSHLQTAFKSCSVTERPVHTPCMRLARTLHVAERSNKETLNILSIWNSHNLNEGSVPAENLKLRDAIGSARLGPLEK